MTKVISTFFSYGGKPRQSELELLRVFVDRIRSIGPQFEIILTTDKDTSGYLAGIPATVYVTSVDRETLLLDRCRANLEIMQNLTGTRQLIFSDYDIIFNSIPNPEEEESLLVTVRKASKYPINGGLLIFSNPSSKSDRLYRSVLENYMMCSPEDRGWWGDQISLYQTLSSYSDFILNLNSFQAEGIKIVPVAAEEYNWTPFDMDVSTRTLWKNFYLDASALDLYRARPVIHFKGPRKHLMMQYARSKFGLNPQALPRWFSPTRINSLSNRVAELEAALSGGVAEPSSIWDTADGIFSLIPLLKNEGKLDNHTRERITNLLLRLYKIHQDFRFNLILNKGYKTQSV